MNVKYLIHLKVNINKHYFIIIYLLLIYNFNVDLPEADDVKTQSSGTSLNFRFGRFLYMRNVGRIAPDAETHI